LEKQFFRFSANRVTVTASSVVFWGEVAGEKGAYPHVSVLPNIYNAR